jgi:hypothetical protein
VCSVEEYWARIGNIPLIKERETSDKEAVLCRTLEGAPVRVTKPEFFRSDDERAAAIELLEDFYKKSRH